MYIIMLVNVFKYGSLRLGLYQHTPKSVICGPFTLRWLQCIRHIHMDEHQRTDITSDLVSYALEKGLSTVTCCPLK